MRLQDAVDGRRELVKAGLIPPHSVGERLKFWEGGGNVLFPKVNCPGDNSEGGRQVRSCSGIVLITITSNNTGYCGVGGIHGGVSVTVYEAFGRG